MKKFNEEWRTIDEFPDYEVSNLGRVRNKKSGYIKKGIISTHKKYIRIIIDFWVDGKTIQRRLSRIAAKAFPEICGEWFDDCEVHHIDENPLNNSADNLKVCTVKEHHDYHREEVVEKNNKRTGINNPNYGKPLSEEHRRKIGDAQRGEKSYWHGKTPPHHVVEAAIRKLSKPICQYTLDGEFVREWKSATEAARALGCCYVGIGNCCRGTKKTCHGFLWRFKNTDE